MDLENLVEIGIQRRGEHPRGGGLPRAHFTGEQAHAGMLGEELEPGLDLLPGRRGEQLLGVGAVGEGRLLEAEKSFPHYR
jgi:hypothetical protein